MKFVARFIHKTLITIILIAIGQFLFFFIMFINISISIMKFAVGGTLMFLAIIRNHVVVDVLDIFVVFAMMLFFVLCCSTVAPALKNMRGETIPCLTMLIIADFSVHGVNETILTSINIICLTDE